jgi:pyruvate formate lyase activating enzyme
VKNSYKKYEDTAGARVNTDDISRSIELVRSLPEHEFRTTVVPGLVEPEDVADICTYIKGAKQLVLQRFHPENVLNKEYSEVSPPTDEEMEALTASCKGVVPTEWRG